MATHTVTKSVSTGTGMLSHSNDYTATSLVEVTEAVANGQTDKQINVAVDVSEIESVYIVSDQDVTLETNSGSAADETLSLLAGVPYEWQSDSYFANLLETDITAVFITNASGSTANIYIRVLQDATP